MERFTFFAYNQDFSLFGFQHVLAMILMILLCIVIPGGAKKYLNSEQQIKLSRMMAVLICFTDIAYLAILMLLGKFNYQTDLPLDICNITAILLPFLMWKPSFRVHEVLYFWILAGTLQAIITPHLFNGFPNFIFIKYWVVHAGLVIYAVYVTVVFKFYPTLKSILKAFIAFQIYIVLVMGINLLLDSNYVYVMRKPPTASMLDYLGPWPVYIFMGELVCVALFFLVYLPLGVRKLWARGNK